ncbi:MAG TPA: F0F1 ATP synthase subunit A [Cellulomonas sp.]
MARIDPTITEECALTSLITVLRLAADDGGGFQAPTIADFFPAPVLSVGTWLQFDRIEFARIVAALVVIAVFVVAARRAQLVPGRFQAAIEWVLDFVRHGVAEDVLGKESAGRYVPLLTTVFVAILAFNLTGIIPGLNIAGTSRIGLPLMFALWVYITYLAAGVRKHGLGGFLKTSLFPSGVPPFMYVLLTPVEILQVFVLRPATLALRLMANMVAGHLMLVLCFSASEYFLFEAVPAMKAFGLLTFVSGFVMTLFEAFVAALQAYIFTILAAVYISLSTADEH